ncbi:MAG: TniQ family protein [Rubrivivax sp.]|nr:TniQ family protein [Rubrivivax sp.]
MIIPTIQPDEWLEGYRGRLSRLSDISVRVGVEPALRNFMAHRRDDTESPLSFIGMISMALGMPTSDIVLRHTLWPAQIAVDRTSDHEVIARRAADIDGKFMFSRPMRLQTWLCPRCAEDDLNHLPFSYWRRSHQLPGQLFCRDHGHELQFVPRSNHLVHLPHEHLGVATPSSTELLERMRRSVHVTRAMQISNAILEGQFIPSRGHCSAVLSRRAKALSMTADAAGRFPEVKDLVDQHIPRAWLKDAMPKVTARLESMAFVDHVFDTSLAGLSGVAIAVVAAMLYDDANGALKAMGADVPSKKRSAGPRAINLPQLAVSTPIAALP